jgi:hypothetical protein
MGKADTLTLEEVGEDLERKDNFMEALAVVERLLFVFQRQTLATIIPDL